MSLRQKIKWWWERVNGRLPECDCWDYKDTLIENIKQGMEYLLRENGGLKFWDNKEHKKRVERLQFVLDFCKEYEELNKNGFYISDEPYVDVAPVKQVTKEEWKAFEKRKNKAFKILGEDLFSLWD